MGLSLGLPRCSATLRGPGHFWVVPSSLSRILQPAPLSIISMRSPGEVTYGFMCTDVVRAHTSYIGVTQETEILPVSSWATQVYRKAKWLLARDDSCCLQVTRFPCVTRWPGTESGDGQGEAEALRHSSHWLCSIWLVTTSSWHSSQQILHFGREMQKKHICMKAAKGPKSPAATVVPLFFPSCFPMKRKQ